MAFLVHEKCKPMGTITMFIYDFNLFQTFILLLRRELSSMGFYPSSGEKNHRHRRNIYSLGNRVEEDVIQEDQFTVNSTNIKMAAPFNGLY